jgi:hypothetical protein
MLWQYTELLFVLGVFLTFMGFYTKVDRFARVMFIFFSAVVWNTVGQGLLKIDYKWGGSMNVVSYTFIPAGESAISYIFNWMTVIFIIIGFVRFIDIVWHGNDTEKMWLGE